MPRHRVADAPALTWVLVNGLPHHVSEFAHLRPRTRPPAVCPQCHRRLTLKLGAIMRHHAAHERGWTCPAIRAETALHLDCKLAIAAALQRRIGSNPTLRIRRCCVGAGASPCDRIDVREWLRDWDDVRVESSLDEARRPDITVLRGGQPIGAIEIVVTNPISADKRAALATASHQWIEVRATESLARLNGWSPDEPLDVVRANEAEPWRCPFHAEQHAAAVAHAALERLERIESDRASATLRAARVVDIYHAGGTRERVIYRVSELRRDGMRHAVRLSRGTLVLAEHPVAPDAGDHDAESTAAVRDAFRADVAHLCRDDRAFADSPMHWATGDAAEFIVGEAAFDRVQSDPTVLATTYPRRWFYASRDARWFIPDDMRQVRWDRPHGDMFAAHPAWRETRGRVGERPAPEGSWKTPIFAQRPIAAMFTAGIFARANHQGIAIIELPVAENAMPRAIVVLDRAVDAGDGVRELADALDARGIDAVWISHPRDWRPALDELPWAPAGRDQRGFGAVLVEDVGVFRADAFARALARNDHRLTREAILRAAERRIAALRGQA